MKKIAITFVLIGIILLFGCSGELALGSKNEIPQQYIETVKTEFNKLYHPDSVCIYGDVLIVRVEGVDNCYTIAFEMSAKNLKGEYGSPKGCEIFAEGEKSWTLFEGDELYLDIYSMANLLREYTGYDVVNEENIDEVKDKFNEMFMYECINGEEFSEAVGCNHLDA